MAKTDRRTSRKLTALLAGAAVLGVGAVATLATWNDSEWVNGLLETSSFEVQQNTAAGAPEASWIDHETLADSGTFVFTPGALALTPGDTVYAPIALRTTDGSDAATIALQAPVPSDADVSDALLWQNLEVAVVTSASPLTCDAAAFADNTAIGTGTLDTFAVTGDDQALAASAGSTQYYCFSFQLIDNADNQTNEALQGLSVEPAFEFVATSVDE